MFSSLLSTTTGSLTLQIALVCTLVSLVLGILVALVYRFDGKGTGSFMTSLILLPMLVQMVIMMVNGNLGTSVAVLGTFGLVRFRSAPGTSKEICFIFLAMAIGLATGTGYLGFAVFMTFVVIAVLILLKVTHLVEGSDLERDLRITIPENLDYTDVFDDIFNVYLKKWTLDRAKTTNLGSMIECKYTVLLRNPKEEKKMLDEIRCRNGNLTIICARRNNEEAL